MARVVKLVTRNRNVIILDLEHDLMGAMQRSAAMLRLGRNLLVFPEGYRARDGRMLPFKRAFAILAKELQVPVVPVVISGAYDCMPHGSILPRRGHINLEILPAIKPGKLGYEALALKVEQAIRKKLGEEA
jgi:long-chain acyl-CoA synthetase